MYELSLIKKENEDERGHSNRNFLANFMHTELIDITMNINYQYKYVLCSDVSSHYDF